MFIVNNKRKITNNSSINFLTYRNRYMNFYIKLIFQSFSIEHSKISDIDTT